MTLQTYSTQTVRDLIRTAENAVRIYQKRAKDSERRHDYGKRDFYNGMQQDANKRLAAYRAELGRRGE